MQLTFTQRELLAAMLAGATLKVHRDLDGEKVHRLHPLEGEPQAVDGELVRALEALNLIRSNLKFPAATYVLTDWAVRLISGE